MPLEPLQAVPAVHPQFDQRVPAHYGGAQRGFDAFFFVNADPDPLLNGRRLRPPLASLEPQQFANLPLNCSPPCIAA